ncbi:MAG: proteasome subunit beta [Desulfurococcaceae archaeon]|uniref:Proteasome subunit beta n=1 Tax=Staphylothermus marinus TaxID=2280 RepID=A0A7C4HBW7_STAMA
MVYSVLSIIPGTIIGIKASDGVVIGGEKRLTYNGFVLSKSVRKVYSITNYTGVGFAGLMGDVEFLVRLLRLEAKNYELNHNRLISPRSLAKILSIILYSYKLFPLITETVVGGIDRDRKPSIYVLDPVGSLIEEKYIALGSGGRVALGYIESSYRDGISVSDAEKIVLDAVKIAIERDVLSGDGVDILVITEKGCEFKEFLFKKTSV